ncbi:MAG TPA: hypothetical protein VMU83_17375 [Hanamia sp.]|nr:hypothetical protein [Hanamia sp.]
MESNLYDFEAEPEKRPSFLTWLCILTFIGSGWSILSCIWSYTTSHKVAATFSENARLRTDSSLHKNTAGVVIREKPNPFEGKMKASFSEILNENNIRKSAIGGFIAALLTLSGALMMWWLYRKGFYLYILGVAFGIIVPFYVYGNDFLAIGISSFANFFGLVFIALYALNLKSLTNGISKNQVSI